MAKTMAEHKGGKLDSRKGQGVSKIVFEMEPDLRLLHGVLNNLRLLGERIDPIDPSAIMVVVRCGEDALERVRQGWQELIVQARSERPE